MPQEDKGEVRECGGCTACCKTLGVPVLNKPPGKWCQYCEIGRECRIYPDRPESCKVFQCYWLASGFGRNEDRPDHSGVVIYFIKYGPLERVFEMFEVSEGRLESRFARETKKLVFQQGIFVLEFYLSGRHVLYAPEGITLPDGTLRDIKNDGIEYIKYSK